MEYHRRYRQRPVDVNPRPQMSRIPYIPPAVLTQSSLAASTARLSQPQDRQHEARHRHHPAGHGPPRRPRGLQSPLHLQMVILGRARPAQKRLGLPQGLHLCPLQRPAPRLRVLLRQQRLRLHELRPLQQLDRHGLGLPEPDELCHRCTHLVFLPSQEHLDPSVSMGRNCLLLPHQHKPRRRQQLVAGLPPLLRYHLQQRHRANRPDPHRR